MRRSLTARALMFGALAALILPATASADIYDSGSLPDSVGINSLWVIVAGLFVFFMQAGFAFLEIGFSRGKNAGTIVAKILVNLAIASILYWAVGFAFAFGGDPGHVIGTHGFFLRDYGDPQAAFPIMGFSNATIESKFFFQFVFCAVSLAIVWGTTLERIKFGVYVLYAIVFSALIYPIFSGWVFGGGWLQNNLGMQDFAGSTAVHLIGATGALAVLLHLGPRKGKFGPDGKPRAIPGHNMPLFGLGIFILWLGWFGFNPGSTLGALDGRFPEVVLTTNIAAAGGVLTAVATAYWKTKTIDIGMAGNGAIAALVGITAGSGYVVPWAALVIGAVAGVIVVLGVYAIDKKIDDPVGALSAHGLAGIWGTLACGLFTHPKLAAFNTVGDGGLVYTGSFHQLLVQAAGVAIVFFGVLTSSYIVFGIIKATYGLRVSEEEELAGLDISEHGMYGYPEQFIPAPELVGYGAAPTGTAAASGVGPVPTHTEVPAT
jgi:ammonium transporter, Amt family